MTLRRIAVPALHLIFEWEDGEGVGFALAVACRGEGGEREIAYAMVRAVSEAAGRLGVEWQDVEMTERYRPVCGMGRVMALVWRGEVLGGGGAESIARIVRGGLGVAEVDDVQGAD